MMQLLRTAGWVACVIYSTIPSFWLMIHPRAKYWRSRRTSPYKILLPVWIGMWALVAATTAPWRSIVISNHTWTWIPAAILFCAGLLLYRLSRLDFSLAQLAGLPEVSPSYRSGKLVMTGIRSHVRHPIYLAHLCEMLGWSVGAGLAVCWSLTVVAIATGAVMIVTEDQELAKRFGDEYQRYQSQVPAVVPKLTR